MKKSAIAVFRSKFHKNICQTILGYRQGSSTMSNADDSSHISVSIASGIAERLGYELCKFPPTGQQAGALFTKHTKDFLNEAFLLLNHLRPGDWEFSSSQSRTGISSFFQYEHLAELKRVLDEHTELKAALGGDYMITPDIMVLRKPVSDEDINVHKKNPCILSDDKIALNTPLRKNNYQAEISMLHASISCKWTMRSDRAQNTRTEALNLMRNRKGRTPNIVAVTFEPLPARIASIALGTGDIDCTYHGALYELMDAARERHHEDALELLQILVEGRRLRDISDLPFDLAV